MSLEELRAVEVSSKRPQDMSAEDVLNEWLALKAGYFDEVDSRGNKLGLATKPTLLARRKELEDYILGRMNQVGLWKVTSPKQEAPATSP